MGKTIQEVIDFIIVKSGVKPPDDTVDTFKIGDPTRPVTGIVTTFMATVAVIREAAARKANLIITHEPTFYSHRDEPGWIETDPVYLAKRNLLEENQITVWRFHDVWHMTEPDGILTGMTKSLGWEPYASQPGGSTFHLPAMTAAGLAQVLKARLGLSTLRLVGDPEMPIQKAVLLMGSIPGEWQINALRVPGVDVIICGETVEWQTCEYVRDANAAGFPKALLAIGHEKSEEGGMAYLVEWLQPHFPHIPIAHISAGDPLRFL